MTCFSINYTRYCHTIKLSIRSIRFRDIFLTISNRWIISKKKFQFLIFICLESSELGAYILSFCLFFRFFFSLLSSPLYLLFSLHLSYPLLFTSLLSSSLLSPYILFSSLLFTAFLFSSLLFTPFLFSSLPYIFLHSG